MGAIGTRLSLRPLFKRGRNEQQNFGQMMSRECGAATLLAVVLAKARPIAPTAYCCASLEPQSRSASTAVVMGPGLRQDDGAVNPVRAMSVRKAPTHHVARPGNARYGLPIAGPDLLWCAVRFARCTNSINP